MTPPAAARAAAEARHERRLISLASTLAAIGGFAATAMIYVPVVWLALMSISGSPLDGLPGAFTLRWYEALWTDHRWLGPLALSVEIALGVAGLCIMSSLLVARALPDSNRARAALLGLFLLPLVIPGVVLGVQEFELYRTILGIRSGIWSLVLTHFIWAFPFALMSMMIVTLRFDRTLLEAASDLGASPWRRFWDIERPLLMPGIVSAGMFGFLLSLTELPRSIFVHGPVVTLPLFLWAEARSRASHVSLIFALNTLIASVSITLGAITVLGLTRNVRGKE